MDIVHKGLAAIAETITHPAQRRDEAGTTRNNTKPNSVNACNDVMIKQIADPKREPFCSELTIEQCRTSQPKQ
jgi:hypothetical protein